MTVKKGCTEEQKKKKRKNCRDNSNPWAPTGTWNYFNRLERPPSHSGFSDFPSTQRLYLWALLVYCLCLVCYIWQKLDSVSMIPVSLFPSTGEEGPEAVLVGAGAFLIPFFFLPWVIPSSSYVSVVRSSPGEVYPCWRSIPQATRGYNHLVPSLSPSRLRMAVASCCHHVLDASQSPDSFVVFPSLCNQFLEFNLLFSILLVDFVFVMKSDRQRH